MRWRVVNSHPQSPDGTHSLGQVLKTKCSLQGYPAGLGYVARGAGQGWFSRLSSLKSTHNRRLPSFFRTMTTGEEYGDLDFFIHSRFSRFCT